MANQDQAYKQFVTKSIQRSLDTIGSSKSGLSEEEAKSRLKSIGLNKFSANEVGWFTIFVRQFKSPFIYILICAALLSFLFGELIDGLLVLFFIAVNTLLSFYQEFRSEQALKLLKKYTKSVTHIIRNNVEISVPSEELVPGDIVILSPGDIIPADLRLIETSNLLIDESVLTGESVPMPKDIKELSSSSVPIHQLTNITFSSTSVVSGQGLGVIIATGPNAYIGSIVKLTIETHDVSSFEKGMGKFSTFVLRLVGITLFVVFFANLLIKGGSANIIELIIFSIALAVAVIPEALPLVITFSLSRGAARLAKHNVVVKRLSAIEDMGGIQVLCTDKTGTITENKLEVAEIYGDKNLVLSYANMAISHKFNRKDPFDIALENALVSESIVLTPDKLLQELPFDPERRRNSVLTEYKGKNLLIVRGASESLLPYTTSRRKQDLQNWLQHQEGLGRRVIVIAYKEVQSTSDYGREYEESSLFLTGAISFIDPIKESTYDAIKKAQALGVSIKIITGDSSIVAGVVAKDVGLVEDSNEVITAEKFFSLSNIEQIKSAERFSVFARFSPRDKHQLIGILQSKFDVGFLGEGINDAPALKVANVALVVDGASDIARDSADVILLNPSLSVIIDGIQEGREVFANTIKYVKITLASNFGNFYAVAIASLIIDFLPMLPIQILLVNLLSDIPLIAISADSVDADEIQKPEGYNMRDFALIATILGLVSTVFDFIFFGLFYRISPEVLQTNWFIGSILTELALVYSLRTRLPFYKAKLPPMMILNLTIMAAVTTLIIPFTQIGQSIFKFTPPSPDHFVLIICIVMLYFISTEAVKQMYYRIFKSR